MLRRRLLPLVPALAIGVTAVVLVPAGSASAAPPVETAGKTYVALGDSYAAGFGLPATVATPTGQPVAGCAQTTGDYPHLLATTLGLTLTDVTCSGATTVDFSNPQTTPAGTAPAQLDVFKTVQPDLVTITIGGNDLGFTAISATCLAASKDGPIFSATKFASCKAYYSTPNGQGGGKKQNPYDKIPTVLGKVDQAIKAVQAAAPKAKIAVIAYPAIAPDVANTPAAGCFAANPTPGPIPLPGLPVSVTSTLPFTDTDVPFLQVLQQQLNEGIAATAAANGAAYADIYTDSLAHSACEPEADRWVEPLLPSGGGTNSLHPNIAGTTAMAAALAPVVTGLFPVAPTSPSSPVPSATGSAPTLTAPATVPPLGNGTAPLAATGTTVPVAWLIGLGVVLLVSGGVSVRWGRTKATARH